MELLIVFSGSLVFPIVLLYLGNKSRLKLELELNRLREKFEKTHLIDQGLIGQQIEAIKVLKPILALLPQQLIEWNNRSPNRSIEDSVSASNIEEQEEISKRIKVNSILLPKSISDNLIEISADLEHYGAMVNTRNIYYLNKLEYPGHEYGKDYDKFYKEVTDLEKKLNKRIKLSLDLLETFLGLN